MVFVASELEDLFQEKTFYIMKLLDGAHLKFQISKIHSVVSHMASGRLPYSLSSISFIFYNNSPPELEFAIPKIENVSIHWINNSFFRCDPSQTLLLQGLVNAAQAIINPFFL